MFSMHRFDNRRILVILNLVDCVSLSFYHCKGSDSSMLEFSVFGRILAVIFVEKFLSYF